MLSGNVVQLHNILPFFHLHHVGCNIFNRHLLASLGCTNASMLQFQDGFSVSKQPSPHPLVDGECHHLCDCLKAGDGTVVCLVLSVSSIEDEDRPPFEEQVVLLLPGTRYFPLNYLLHQLIHRFHDRRTRIDREGVYTVDSTGFPWSRTREGIFKLLFRECVPFASSLSCLQFHSPEDLQDGHVLSQSFYYFLVIDAFPKRE